MAERSAMLRLALPCAVAIIAASSGTACGGAARMVQAVKDTAVMDERSALVRGMVPNVQTRAERSHFTTTSTYADVMAFLAELARADSQRAGGPRMAMTTIGTTNEGRALPLVILSRPLVRTPLEAHRLGRPIIYVQANIHAGEVEGKEALQELIRNLAFWPRADVLDSVVLLAQPIYNADGNERFAPQERNRGEQNGPEMVGQRPNAQGLDLNRDYMKMEAPETRASVAAWTAWDPDVFVDLHTTDGSFHGYALTYSPSLNPSAIFGGAYARDSMLPVIRARMRRFHGFDVFDYGNFRCEYVIGGSATPGRPIGDMGRTCADSVQNAWETYDSRPRFGTNYFGVRGRIAILSEAFSHDPFERRVASTYYYVREILSLSAQRARAIVALSRAADSEMAAWSRDPASAPALPLRSKMTSTPYQGDVLAEDLERVADTSVRTQPGVPKGLRRTGHIAPHRMPVYDHFDGTLTRTVPSAYAIPAAETAVVRVLRAHGLVAEPLEREWSARVQHFRVDSIRRASRSFQGHNEVALEGAWSDDRRALPAGTLIVSTGQPHGLSAFYLLEPESDDGLETWNLFDHALAIGRDFPILRVMEPEPVRRR
jgi:hypothetical protein